MREAPDDVSDEEVLALVRRHWDDTVVAVTHLAVGFGAHHWQAVDASGGPVLFLTFDRADARRTVADLEATYAAAAHLAASGLEFVHACRRTLDGAFTVPLADGALSATPWLAGSAHDFGPLRTRAEAEATAAMIHRLHGSTPPPGLLDWAPAVDRTFPANLALRLGSPWHTGPYGERARQALVARVGDVGRWSAAYLRLVDVAARLPWVVTHGEPHLANQLVTASGQVLVDWETLRRAPAERDLRVLVEGGFANLCRPEGGDPDWAMVELFDLEWRLDEIAQYAAWFSAPHTGTASDAVAYGGLLGELEREDFKPPT